MYLFSRIAQKVMFSIARRWNVLIVILLLVVLVMKVNHNYNNLENCKILIFFITKGCINLSDGPHALGQCLPDYNFCLNGSLYREVSIDRHKLFFFQIYWLIEFTFQTCPKNTVYVDIEVCVSPSQCGIIMILLKQIFTFIIP